MQLHVLHEQTVCVLVVQTCKLLLCCKDSNLNVLPTTTPACSQASAPVFLLHGAQ